MKLIRDLGRRAELYAAIDRGEIGFPDALRLLRRCIGKTQTEYAELVGLSPRVLKEIEQGRGNPTLKSIRKALKPFGLDITVGRARHSVPPTDVGDRGWGKIEKTFTEQIGCKDR